MWYLIVSFPDLYLLSYVASKKLDVTVFAERRGQMSLLYSLQEPHSHKLAQTVRWADKQKEKGVPELCQFLLNFKIIKDKAHLRQGG